MLDPSHYRTIAVASTFSPRFAQVLAEAKRIRDRFGARLNLIYVGERSDETAQKFAEIIRELELPADSPVHYQAGDPAVAILEMASAHNVDLIVAGALEKEVVLRPFLGNVARRLVRDAGCSVMLFTAPERPPKKLCTIVFVATDYSEHEQRALKKTLHLAALEKCEKLYVVRVYTTFDEARAALRKGDDKARTLEEEEAALEKFILDAGHTDVPIEARCVRGNTGYAASDFVQSVKANLLVVPLRSEAEAGDVPNHLSWVIDVIPCNLWIIR